ncbi:MAG: hypothetical protein IJY23_00550 [Clostridia bacterium]|nr:hypothetical protein [Clostridia bacterium]
MTSFEKAEIRRLPKKYRPKGGWSYFWRNLIYMIPVLGWIVLICHACSDKNINRRSYAKFGCWVLLVVVAALAAVAYLLYSGTLSIDTIVDALLKVKELLPAAE